MSCFQLFIAVLPVMVYDRTAIIMACPNGAFKNIESLPESIITEMRSVKDHMQAVHFFEEFNTLFTHFAGGIRSVGIAARAVMCRTQGTQAVSIGAFQIM